MIYIFLGLVALLCLVAQSSLFSGHLLGYVRPDCILAITLFSGFHLSRSPGLLYAFFLGYLADTLSGSPDGWNAFFMTVVFFLTQGLRSQIFIKGILPRIITVILFAAFKGPCFLLIMKSTGNPASFTPTMLVHWIGETVTTVVVTLLLFHYMYRIHDADVLFSFCNEKQIYP